MSFNNKGKTGMNRRQFLVASAAATVGKLWLSSGWLGEEGCLAPCRRNCDLSWSDACSSFKCFILRGFMVATLGGGENLTACDNFSSQGSPLEHSENCALCVTV